MVNNIVIIIGTFLMALAGIVHTDFSKKLIYRKNFIFIILGIVFIAFGTFLSAVKQSKLEQEQIELLKNNSRLNQEIAEISKRSLDSITGGDSYVVVMPTFTSKDHDTLSLIVTSYGDYPIYDIKIDVVDLDQSRELENQFSFEEKKNNPSLVVSQIMKAHYSFDIGNKTQGQGKFVPVNFKLNYKNLTKRGFNIKIFARNGIFNEKLRLKKIDNVWVSAYKVSSTYGTKSEEKVLFTRIDEKYTEIDSDW